VRSKADTSQLNRPHGNQQVKVENEKELKSKKQKAGCFLEKVGEINTLFWWRIVIFFIAA